MAEFEEIAHSGGTITLTTADIEGKKHISFAYSNSRPVPASLFGVYAVPPGIVVENFSLAGLGQASEPPAFPNSIPVLIGSDCEGQYGHNCPRCTKYWRSGSHPKFCPYCGLEADSIYFLSHAQAAYIRHYIRKWEELGIAETPSTRVIDMDEIADTTLKSADRPDFYISDERQQTHLVCQECGEFNDILGRFGHCSLCFTRNDHAVFRDEIVPSIRSALNDGRAPEQCLRDAVSAFEVFIKQICGALKSGVPMTPQRRDRLTKSNFSSWTQIDALFSDLFGIEARSKFDSVSWNKFNQMVMRRHVYEHSGGVVDQEYLEKSDDATVRLGQQIVENVGDVHEFLSAASKFAEIIHTGFHSIFPPDRAPIERFRKKRNSP
jgi:hypothetical protein